MFAGIRAKITALLTAIIGGLLIVLKLKSDKVERLQDKVDTSEKLDEIREEQKEATKEVLKDEAETIKEKTKPIIQSPAVSSRRKRINRMRNNQTSS